MSFTGVVIYLFVLIAAVLFRFGYLGWFGPFLLWAVVLLPPALFLLSLPAMRRMRLQLSVPSSITRGEAAELSVSFLTDRRFPVGKVHISLRSVNLHTGQTQQYRYRFDAVSRSVGRIPLPSDACGAVRISVERWSCADVLNLFFLLRKNPEPVTCTVLPAPIPPARQVEAEHLPEEPVRLKPKYGGGYAEDYDLREYREGDQLNSIHWKLSAKTDRLIVREALIPENSRIYAVVYRTGTDDRGLECLYWLSLKLCESGLPHVIVADACYEVKDPADTEAALCAILRREHTPPCLASFPDARFLYEIWEGEVRFR
ncbi:MAG: DUF58 domain-containing protein [Oscillospiraceae bacterium]|nr:DUF58 domain-containing protein [Oscillospiraceae bacterium]